MVNFSIVESLEFGWHKTRQHSALLFKVLLTLFALQVAYQVVDRVLPGTLTGVLAQIVLMIVGIILGAGFTSILLKLSGGHPAHYRDIVPELSVVWKYFCASLIASVIICLGFIALIIPGIYLLLRFSMVRFAIMDGADITESLRKSSKMTHGHKWRLLGFFLAVIGINIIGAILFVVGLLLTIPTTALAFAHVYQKLKHHS